MKRTATLWPWNEQRRLVGRQGIEQTKGETYKERAKGAEDSGKALTIARNETMRESSMKTSTVASETAGMRDARDRQSGTRTWSAVVVKILKKMVITVSNHRFEGTGKGFGGVFTWLTDNQR